MAQEKTISGFKGFKSSSLNDEIIEIRIQIRNIIKLSIFWSGVGNLGGSWPRTHKIFIFFISLVRFCTEYILIYFFFPKL